MFYKYKIAALLNNAKQLEITKISNNTPMFKKC